MKRFLQPRFAILALLVIGAGSTSAQVTSAPPPPPEVKPPVDFFRELLALTSDQRDAALKDRSPQNKSAILAKVREYESLNPDERELRLRATELRWHLLRLMPISSSNRVDQIHSIAEPMRKLVEDRLATWDKLSPAAKEEAVQGGPDSLQRKVQVLTRRLSLPSSNAPKLSAEQLQKLNESLARIRRLSADQQKLIAQLDHFFELKTEEKTKVLGAFSESERKEIDKTLQKFARLPKDQQARCVSAVQKLAGMSADECRQFLQNAERWRTMSPAERQAWRDLVRKLPGTPPSPAALSPPPPNPPGLHEPVVSTNKRTSNQL